MIGNRLLNTPLEVLDEESAQHRREAEHVAQAIWQTGEIRDAVLYLSSHESRHIIGTDLAIDAYGSNFSDRRRQL